MNTILLVEPEGVFRRSLETQLSGRYEIFVASSPVHAIDICRAHRQIDVLVTDADMGLVSGMEMASLLRAWIPELKAVLLSELTEDTWTDRQIAELNELPADGTIVLRKPLPPGALEPALAELTAARVASVGA